MNIRVRFYLFFLIILLGVTTVAAQNINVAGTVIDENGEPVIGATVLVKGG